MSKAREKRRTATIHAYVGENGGGKSLAAIYDTIPSLLEGRKVAATVMFLDPDREASCVEEAEEAWSALGIDERPTRLLALPHPLWTPITRWADLLDLERTDLLLDEAQGVVNSRASQALPAAVLTTLLQLRRKDVVCRWTTPSYQRADVALREVTQAVTYCKGYRPEAQKPCKLGCDREHEHVSRRLWGANRTFYWRTFNALDFDEFTSSDTVKEQSRDRLRVLARQVYNRRRGNAQRFYDTMAPVLMIRDGVETGTCLACGGSRRRPSCSCPQPHRHEERTRSGAPQGRALRQVPTS